MSQFQIVVMNGKRQHHQRPDMRRRYLCRQRDRRVRHGDAARPQPVRDAHHQGDDHQGCGGDPCAPARACGRWRHPVGVGYRGWCNGPGILGRDHGGRRGDGRLRDLGVERIATLRQCAQQLRAIMAESAAKLGHALGDAVVGDDHARPHRLHEVVARHHLAGMPGEVLQNLGGFRPQAEHRAVRPVQHTSRNIQRVPIEVEGCSLCGRVCRVLVPGGIHRSRLRH
jgi:hypothetical protein